MEPGLWLWREEMRKDREEATWRLDRELESQTDCNLRKRGTQKEGWLSPEQLSGCLAISSKFSTLWTPSAERCGLPVDPRPPAELTKEEPSIFSRLIFFGKPSSITLSKLSADQIRRAAGPRKPEPR